MIDYLEIHELYHHGIKGQRWGIRRFQNEDGTLTSEGKQRYSVDNNGQMSKEGKKLYKSDKLANRSVAGNTALGALKGSAIGYAGAAVTAGVLAGIGYLVLQNGKGKGRNLVIGAVEGIENHKEAANIVADILMGTAVAGGAAVGAKKAYDKQKKAKENSIEHSGIKGQKWGIRRYQNEDGTLTDAGKARYNSDGSKKKTETMSNDELNKANQRLAAERNYNSLMGKNYKNRSSNTDIAIRAGASAIGSALASAGAYIIRDKAKHPDVSIGKDKLKTAGLLAILGASIGSISSVATSLGGQANIQNIGDQKKNK